MALRSHATTNANRSDTANELRIEGDGSLSGAWEFGDAQIGLDDPDDMDAEQRVPQLNGLACRIQPLGGENSGLSNDRSLVDGSTSLVRIDWPFLAGQRRSQNDPMLQLAILLTRYLQPSEATGRSHGQMADRQRNWIRQAGEA